MDTRHPSHPTLPDTPEPEPRPAFADLDEVELARLIAALPPAPEGWVRAAQELPAARRAIDGLVEEAVASAERRESILRDLEQALRDAGQEPRRELVDELRERLVRGER
jgi:hypothetical protein